MVCGAVTGGVMGLGIHLGWNEVNRQERKAYWFAQEFLDRFERKQGSLTSRELTGCDFHRRRNANNSPNNATAKSHGHPS
jgi:C_GCAxxG_C_C family probable redox protein